VVLAVTAVALVALVWVQAGAYYLTDTWDRVDHPLHGLWRSSGTVGHGLGIAGAALILVNLSFLLRRHWARLRGLGRLRTWLDAHVVTGLFGPLLVVFHTALDLRSTVAVTAFVSLGVLVVTGIVGRFIYTLVPHTVAGVELAPAALRERVQELSRALRDALGEGAASALDPAIARLGAPPPLLPKTALGCLVALPVLAVDLRLTRRRAQRLARETFPPGTPGRDRDVAELTELALLSRRLHTLSVTRRLLRGWRSLHRIFAVLMVVLAIVHVGVALYFGYDGGVL